MSGAGKKIADVTFKARKTVDWDGMVMLTVSDEARKEFTNLRRALPTTMSTHSFGLSLARDPNSPLVELQEAEQASLKASSRLEMKIADVREFEEEAQYHDS